MAAKPFTELADITSLEWSGPSKLAHALTPPKIISKDADYAKAEEMKAKLHLYVGESAASEAIQRRGSGLPPM